MVGLHSFNLRCVVVFRNPSSSWSGASLYIGTHFLARIRNLLRRSRAVHRNLVESDLRWALSDLFDLDGIYLSQWMIVTRPKALTRPNTGGSRPLPMRTSWAARVAQFCRSVELLAARGGESRSL